ncbi:hypothetical protein J3R82DRAFT_7943 [Butyriboletus roseoflavus]|nr:hypothetical protein J3R82DRAFT_7943 [Butyriboletus roseoflavus]
MSNCNLSLPVRLILAKWLAKHRPVWTYHYDATVMSSPRQKMVAASSPQPNELEQKKKRQTLERAKANHLSKQLQMRLQYAKLKVEHGWQRQNLNEVENLYFHHSHLRSMRQRSHHATVTETHVQSPASSAVPDRTVGPSPSVNDASSSGSISPPSQSSSEHAHSAALSSQPQLYPPIQAPVPVAPCSVSTNRPPSAFDLSDPNILTRLAQLQAQVQVPLQSQVQTLSHQPPTTIPHPRPRPRPHLHPRSLSPCPAFPFPPTSLNLSLARQRPGLCPSTPSPPLTPPPRHTISQPLPNHPSPSLSLSPASASPTVPIPNTPIASTALTYDSFWSTHASSTGPTRALYRTHTGFTASATPGGNVAMLTPGGHAAIMTAEGVYVGGASNRSG